MLDKAAAEYKGKLREVEVQTVSYIRIYHECEGRIEKSVPRIKAWHHKACRVMTTGDPEGWIFYPTLTRIMDSFSCSSLFYILK